MLPPEHFWSRAVANISERIMDAANEGHGEGYQDHMKELTWNIFVIDEPIYNAYAFLGKGSYNIVFYSGENKNLKTLDPALTCFLSLWDFLILFFTFDGFMQGS